MTPANIVGMAALKELDVIALTDHNTCKNCAAFMNLTKKYGILGIPGMELTTLEEVHVLCLLPDLKAAERFDEYVSSRLIPIKNKPEIFGKQQIMNDKDEVIGILDNLLINSTSIGFSEVYEIVYSYQGIMIPAHIDKKSNSLLANLGFVPPDSRFECFELKNMANLHTIQNANPYLRKCRVITNSDAHYLENINEAVNTLYVKEKTVKSVLEELEGGSI